MIYCKQLCWAYASRLIARQKSTILGFNGPFREFEV